MYGFQAMTPASMGGLVVDHDWFAKQFLRLYNRYYPDNPQRQERVVGAVAVFEDNAPVLVAVNSAVPYNGNSDLALPRAEPASRVASATHIGQVEAVAVRVGR